MKHKHTLRGLVLILALTVACAAQSTGDTHIVRSGDSLSKIAARNGTTTDALVRLNEGKYPSLRDDPGLIRVGWVLNVGQGGGSQPPPADRRVESPVPTEEQMRQVEQEIIRLTNEARREQGLHELTVDPVLMEVARERARQLPGNCSHYGPNGEVLCREVAARRGYGPTHALSENIDHTLSGDDPSVGQAAYYDRLVTRWLDSPGHRGNILRSNAHRLGVGVVYRAPFYWYAVQIFGP